MTAFTCGLVIGIVVGIGVTLLLWQLWMNVEWSARRKLERQVQSLYRHLSCGAGFLGCDGGPDCNYDHK